MKAEKQLLLDEIKVQLTHKPSFLIAQYEKLTANKANEFRREMKKYGVHLEMMRKRMLLKAAENATAAKLSIDLLPGHIGIIFINNDPVEATKAVLQFSSSNDNCLKLLGAQVDGQLVNASDVKRLSELPSKPQMRAQFLGLLEAPMAETLAIFEALLSSVVYCLDNKVQNEQGQE